MIHPIAWIALVVALVALAGVGYIIWDREATRATVGPSVDGTPLASVAAAVKALPACSELFVPGKVIDNAKVLNGCKDAHGGVEILAYFTCADGKHLYQVDAKIGAPVGYGYGGGKFVAVKGDVAANAGYGKAYSACNG